MEIILRKLNYLLKFVINLPVTMINLFKTFVLVVFGFSKDECKSLKLLADRKKKHAYNWYFNNVIFSVLLIFVPFILTIIHLKFGTISFNKSLLEIIIGGSVSLTGINILRSASTMITDKFDESKMYEKSKEEWNHVKQEILSIKNKLNIAVLVLTILGSFSYLFQVTAIVNTSNDAIYWFLLGFVVIFLVSIVIGRSLHIMNTNLIDDEETVRMWYSELKQSNTQMIENVNKKIAEEGL